MSALSGRLGWVFGFVVALCVVSSAVGVVGANDGIQTDDPLESGVNETTNTTDDLTSTATPTPTATVTDTSTTELTLTTTATETTATIDSDSDVAVDSETTLDADGTIDSETTLDTDATIDSETTLGSDTTVDSEATLDSATSRSISQVGDDVNDTLDDADTGLTETELGGVSSVSTTLVADSGSTEAGQDDAATRTDDSPSSESNASADAAGGTERLSADSLKADTQATLGGELIEHLVRPVSESPSSWIPVAGATALAVGAGAAMLTPGGMGSFGQSMRLVGQVGFDRASLVDAARRVVRRPLAILGGLRQHYREDDRPEHEVRRSLFETVRDQPGIHLSELSRAVDAPLSTVRYHVRVLEDEGFLQTAKHRGKRRYYPSWMTDHELSTALSDTATARLVCALYQLESAGVSRLADEVGRDVSTVSHHLSNLEQDGIVVRERDGRTVVNRLSPDVRESLSENCSKHLC